MFDFAEDASDNPTFYADLHEPQSLNKYQYAYNNPLRYVDPDGHGIKDWLKSAAKSAGEFAGGVARGVAASMSYGTAPHSEPSSDDSVASRLGQVVGSALVIVGGSQTTGAGIAVSGTGAGAVVGVPVAIAGVVAVAGGIVNASKVVTTPLNKKGREYSSGDVERMKQGRPPVGEDGHPVELHHPNQKATAPVKEMTRTEHRGKGNYGRNHPHGNKKPSQIDRQKFKQQREQYWKDKVKKVGGESN